MRIFSTTPFYIYIYIYMPVVRSVKDMFLFIVVTRERGVHNYDKGIFLESLHSTKETMAVN
jgi:hypothetical protein